MEINSSENMSVEFKNFTTYSISDGFIKIDDLLNSESVKKTRVAVISDDSTLSGVPEFLEKCEKNNIKGIIGVTLHIKEKNSINDLGTISLYAKNQEGLDNLKKIVSSIENIYDEKLIDINKILKNSENLVALIGGKNSVVQNFIEKDNPEFAEKYITLLKENFGNDMFMDIQVNDVSSNEVNRSLFELAKKTKVRIFASNNNRFNNKHDYYLFKEKIQKAKGINASLKEGYYTEADYIMTEKQKFNFFYKDKKSLLNNSHSVVSFFEDVTIFKEIPEIPKSLGSKKLRQVISEIYPKFISKIPPENKKVYQDRIKEELLIIENLGFDNYFLIFDGIVKNLKNDNNMGFAIRGSGASSLITYMLGLSNIDPIENGLLFERFLNHGRGKRHELPDLDLDTTDVKNVLNYLKNSYTEDNVAMLLSSSQVKAKVQIKMAYNAIIEEKDFNLDLKITVPTENEMESLVKIVERNFGSNDRNLTEEVSKNYHLRKFLRENNHLYGFINYAKKLDNQIFNQSRSVASLVISNNHIENNFSIKKDDSFVINNIIEVEKNYIEKMGLVKLDILSNLYLKKTLNAYNDLNFNWIEKGKKYQNQEVYNLLSNGLTVSINQLKSKTQSQLCKDVSIDSFEELMTVVALLRPGVDRKDRELYIERKNNKEKIEYKHKYIEEVLASTYGVIIFDEQIMKLAQKVGNLQPSESDDFRSAIKKNKIELLKEFKPKFIKGAQAKGIPTDVATSIYDDLESIAGKYTFSKAHAAVYSDLIYKQAFLKEKYPSEYIKYYLLENKKELSEYLIEATTERNIKVLPVSINRSSSTFKTRYSKTQNIRAIDFSLTHVLKGDESLAKIIEEERTNGVYTNIYNFIERVLPLYSGLNVFSEEWIDNPSEKLSFINKVNLLVDSGAFDNISPKELNNDIQKIRSVLKESIPNAVELVVNPYVEGDFEYKIPNELLTLDSIVKNEERIYSIQISNLNNNNTLQKVKKNRNKY